jgi:hypothetical protein
MEMAMNGWIKDVELRTELEALALDMLFGFGCAKIGLEERGDYSGCHGGVMGRFTMDALTPYMVRIAPGNVVIDSQCDSVYSARFVGHMFQRDLEDLKDDERYDQAVVAQLTADDEKRVGRSGDERAFKDVGSTGDASRGRVTMYEIFMPETRQIGTLAVNHAGDEGSWVRALQPFHGPKTGPYCLFGVYMVPDQVYPLSPVAAMAEQDQELNAHATAAAKEAATAKSVVLVNADQPELASEIQRAENNSIVKVKGLNANSIVPVALGGTTEQRLAYLNLLLQRTDRNSGQSDAARGKAQGVTATEAHIAHDDGDARTEFMHLKYRDAVKEGLKKVGWYMYHDPAVVMEVNTTDPTTGQPFEGVFLGGIQPGQEDTDWAGFFLEIEPMSMRRVDPVVEQQRAQLCVELVTSIAPLIPSLPYINWAQVLDLIGQANNMPDFSKTILNAQGLAMIQASMMPGTMPGQNPMAGQTLGPGASAGVQQAAAGMPVAQMPPGGTPAQQTGAMPGGGKLPPAPTAAEMMLGKSMGRGLGTAPGVAGPFGQAA